MSSKVRLIIPGRDRSFPDDTVILDNGPADRHLGGKRINLIEVTGELKTQNDVRDLMRKLEVAYTYLDTEPMQYFEAPIQRRETKY
jgi:hypothetical protein